MPEVAAAIERDALLDAARVTGDDAVARYRKATLVAKFAGKANARLYRSPDAAAVLTDLKWDADLFGFKIGRIEPLHFDGFELFEMISGKFH